VLTQERQAQIIRMIQNEGSVKVSKLTKLFNVSIETIRRDLETLEKSEVLKRVYGGAILKKGYEYKSDFGAREIEFREEKEYMAQIAVKYIENGQSIAMDGGTTNLEIAKVMKSMFNNLTILTNSLAIANELFDKDEFTVILSGGILNNKERCFTGVFWENIFSDFTVDKALISVSGVSLTNGATDYWLDQIPMQRQMIKIANEVILLAQSNKIDNVSLVKVTDLDDINLIITDSKLDDSILKKYLENGIEIVKK
jgi:DeoR family fructose operon transcriptional repressor